MFAHVTFQGHEYVLRNGETSKYTHDVLTDCTGEPCAYCGSLARPGDNANMVESLSPVEEVLRSDTQTPIDLDSPVAQGAIRVLSKALLVGTVYCAKCSDKHTAEVDESITESGIH